MNYKRALYHFNRSDPEGLPTVEYTNIVLEDLDYYSRNATFLIQLETDCQEHAKSKVNGPISSPYDNQVSLQCCKNAGYHNWPPPYGTSSEQLPPWRGRKDCEPPPYVPWFLKEPQTVINGHLYPSQTLNPRSASGKPWCSKEDDEVWPNGPISPIQKNYDVCITKGNSALTCLLLARQEWKDNPDRQKAKCCQAAIGKYMTLMGECAKNGDLNLIGLNINSSSGGVPN